MRSGKRVSNPIKVVLDTNVLVSAFLWDGNESAVFGQCLEGTVGSLTSQGILHELDDVLERKFGIPNERRFGYLRRILSASRLITITGDLKVLDDDPSDDQILETALLGDADFIVTGDKHLFSLGTFRGIRILKAAELVHIIFGQQCPSVITHVLPFTPLPTQLAKLNSQFSLQGQLPCTNPCPGTWRPCRCHSSP